MLLGLGVDLLSLPRLQGVISRRGAQRLAERICSARELAAFTALPSQHSDPTTLHAQEVRFLASRWAAKEAAYKAMPTWPHGWGWKNLDLSYSARGRPRLALLSPEGKDADAIEQRRARDRAAAADKQEGREGQECEERTAGKKGTVGHDVPAVDLMVSISHDGEMIVAAVVAQTRT